MLLLWGFCLIFIFLGGRVGLGGGLIVAFVAFLLYARYVHIHAGKNWKKNLNAFKIEKEVVM